MHPRQAVIQQTSAGKGSYILQSLAQLPGSLPFGSHIVLEAATDHLAYSGPWLSIYLLFPMPEIPAP